MATARAGSAAALASELCTWIDRLFPDPDRGERLKRALADRFGDDQRLVTDELCREVEAVAQDFSRHFELEYVAGGTLVPDTSWSTSGATAVAIPAPRHSSSTGCSASRPISVT